MGAFTAAGYKKFGIIINIYLIYDQRIITAPYLI